MSDSLTIIEYSVFSGYTSLTSIEIPVNLTTIQTSAFESCYSTVTICNYSNLNLTIDGLREIFSDATIVKSYVVSFDGNEGTVSDTSTAKIFTSATINFSQIALWEATRSPDGTPPQKAVKR